MSDEVQPQDPAPVASTPPADANPATAATPSAGSSLPAGSPPDAGAPSAPAAPADARAEIDALAVSHGFNAADLANYSDVASAEAAIRSHVDRLANNGLQGVRQQPQQQPQYQQPQPPAYQPQQQAPQQQQVQGMDLKAFGLDESDPAAQAIRAMEQQVQGALAQQQELANSLQQVQTDSSSRNHQRLVGQAEDVVASFESPEYGVAGRRTASQEWNTQRLFDLADAIAIGAHNDNRSVPSLPARLQQARLIDSTSQPSSPAIGGQPIPAPAAHNVPGPLAQHSFVTQGAVEPMAMTDSWSSNPELMRLISDNGN